MIVSEHQKARMDFLSKYELWDLLSSNVRQYITWELEQLDKEYEKTIENFTAIDTIPLCSTSRRNP